MHETSEQESYGQGHRTFDCPWCGAICGIDPSHIGEHFECPECNTKTKLTPQNTRGGHATEPPPDAPHHEEGAAGEKAERQPLHEISDLESYGKGHRTFDCPWCGAIAGIDPSHLGESFTCPECHKATKLTPQNTRPSAVTEAAPDAPHHEEKRSKAPLVGLVAALVVVAVVVAVVAGGGGGDEPRGNGEKAAVPPADDTDPSSTPPTDVTPPEEAPPEEGPPEEAPPEEAPPEEMPPEEMPPEEAPPEEMPPEEMPPEEAPPEEMPPEEAPDRVALAEEALAKAKAELAAWEQAHPEILETLVLLRACTAMRAEAARLCEGLEAGGVTPEEARAYNEAVRAFVAADEKRIEAARRVVERLNRERLKPLFLGSWEELNFFLPQVRDTMSILESEGACVESEEYGALLKKVSEAEAALEAASGS